MAPPPPPPGYAAETAPASEGPTDTDAGVEDDAEAPLLSPVVRRLLAENDIDPADVHATGVGGRITREDVLAYIDARHTGPARTSSEPADARLVAEAKESGHRGPLPTGQIQPVSELVTRPLYPVVPAPPPARSPELAGSGTGDRIVPFSNVRRRTAEHMLRSKATAPHAYIATEVDFENVERVRRVAGARFRAEEGFSLTYLPFVARATIEALRDFPNLNASVGADALILHPQVNLGIAVDLHHDGLIVPVVYRADEMTVRGLARRIRDLADRTRRKQLNADEIAGGTFTITNDGPFGTYFTVPIINQPQVAILATDGIKRRPVVVTLTDGSESIAIHSVGLIGVAFDHRAVDGAYVANFLQRVGELLERRDWLAEL
jgi:2-oxoglutarate dehydrogenase E2 component (dihydrolipoamide succinyltransferase)